MRQILTFIFILHGFWTFSQTPSIRINPEADSSKTSISTRLDLPFGTIAKLEVEIYDGDSLYMKAYQGMYLLKIHSVNGKKRLDTLVMTFEDETGELASDNFELFKLMYGKKTNSISEKQIDKMKQSYVGKKLTLMAYETGRFIGMPKDYFKYKPIVAATDFHFKNYIVIVSSLK